MQAGMVHGRKPDNIRPTEPTVEGELDKHND